MRRSFILILCLLLSISLFAKKKGAPPMTSGAPDERTCMTSKCHAGADVNSGDAEITIEGIPEIYTAGEIYEITLRLKQKGAKTWGFIATSIDSSGSYLGTMSPGEGKDTQLMDDSRTKSRTDRRYVSHTEKGIKGPKKGESPTWTIQWEAPESGSPATLHFAFNAANGNKKKTGDMIYTRSVTISPPKK